MTEMRISLPPSLRSFVDQQVAAGGYATPADYVRDLIRRDRDRVTLRNLLLAGAASEPAGEADKEFFERLRRQAAGRPDA
jgi:antitoxin ParD1/3/4